MKIKKPSLKGMKHTSYLGHFAQDKYICEGHNTSGKLPKLGGKWAVSDNPEKRLNQYLSKENEFKGLKEKFRPTIRESISQGKSPKLKWDKPVEKMTPEEKMQNAMEYKAFLETWDEESDPNPFKRRR